VIEGLRERVLSGRPSVSPRNGWNDDQFAASARKKLKRFQRMLASFRRWAPTLDGARVLDVGCGDGANCTLLASELGCMAVGIDLHLPHLALDTEAQRTQVLLDKISEAWRRSEHWDAAVRSKGRACFVEMDATCLGFRPESFDVVLSRSAAEHIRPIGRALAEIERAVRPGGLIYLGIDPFYWLRGCHKRAVVDIPFAHARLSLEEYRHFVAMNEGEEAAAKRWSRLETLNRLTIRQWRETIESMSCEILEWREGRSELGEAVLRENPDVVETLLPGVEESDLLTDRIEVWLRK
jgi:SAM-dependent methyltransferase